MTFVLSGVDENGLFVFQNNDRKQLNQIWFCIELALILVLYSLLPVIIPQQNHPHQCPLSPQHSCYLGDHQLKNGNRGPSLGINTGSDSPDNSQ